MPLPASACEDPLECEADTTESLLKLDSGISSPTRRIMVAKLVSVSLLSVQEGYACRMYRESEGGVGIVLIVSSLTALAPYPNAGVLIFLDAALLTDPNWLCMSPSISRLMRSAASFPGVLPRVGNKSLPGVRPSNGNRPSPTLDLGALANANVLGGDIPCIKSTESSKESLNAVNFGSWFESDACFVREGISNTDEDAEVDVDVDMDEEVAVGFLGVRSYRGRRGDGNVGSLSNLAGRKD